MQRKAFVIFALIAAFIACIAFIALNRSWISNKPGTDMSTSDTGLAADTRVEDSNSENTSVSNNSASGEVRQDNGQAAETQTAVLSEDINVVNNTAEYDVKCSLVFSAPKHLGLKFYIDGTGTERELGIDKIPELSCFPDSNSGNKSSGNVINVYLSIKFEKLFLIVKSLDAAGMSNMAIYSYSLRNDVLSGIANIKGNLSEVAFSGDFRHLAFSYEDSPASSVFQEKSLLEVVSCEKDTGIVKGSRLSNGNVIGGQNDSGLLYDYYFNGWYSHTIIKVKEISYSKTGTGGKKNRELLYDINQNLFKNPDGSDIKPAAGGAQSAAPRDSQAVRTLKTLYSCLSGEDEYAKGMDLLDSNFVIELELLRQFGINSLGKADIDVEQASMYSDILKAARFESLVSEEKSGSKYVVYYYQEIRTEQNQLKQALKAELSSKNGKWSILSIKECSHDEKPFTN